MDIAGINALRGLGYQQIAAGGVDTSTALTVPEGATVAIFKPAAQAIRFRDDGTAPTAAIGYPVAVGTEYVYCSPSISRVRIIAQVAGAALDILYYG
jgi:hypothetical protein